MAEEVNVVRCPICGMEGKLDVRMAIIESMFFSQEEYRRRCVLAKEPSFNFNCNHLQSAIMRSVTPPSAPTK